MDKMTVTIPGRQCGKGMIQELHKALADASTRHHNMAHRWHIGTAVEQALKQYSGVNFKVTDAAPPSIMGLQFQVNDLMPPDGFAIVDKAGRVLAVGNIFKGGADD